MTDSIDFRQTGLLQKLVSDYLFDSDRVASYFTYYPHIETIPDIIQARRSYDVNRELLTECLRQQYQGFDLHDAVDRNIKRLSENNTFTITTAHQPNLLLGPLYVIHKIASVIKLSKLLYEKFPQYHFVPVYWMGSEDHDKEELAQISLFGKPVVWDTAQAGAFGAFTLSDTEDVRKQVFDILGNSEASIALQHILDKYYFSKSNIAEATRSLLNQLFGLYGLIIVDGNDSALKRTFIPVMKEELLQRPSIQKVTETNLQLQQSGYETQATVRDINLFYMRAGQRIRITMKDDAYQVGDFLFTQEHIMQELEAYPERFSPNVILRPLYQSMILPDLIFAGGSAEIAYHLQLKKLFEHFQLHYPMLLLRDTAIYTDHIFQKKLEKFHLSIHDLFKPLQQLVDEQLHKQAPDIFNLSEEREQLTRVYEKLSVRAQRSDKTLLAAVEAEYKKWLHSLEAIEEKLKRSEKRKAEDSLKQLQRLREQILPGNILHERRDNFLQYYLRFGPQYIQKLIDSFDAFETRLKVIPFD